MQPHRGRTGADDADALRVKGVADRRPSSAGSHWTAAGSTSLLARLRSYGWAYRPDATDTGAELGES